MSTHLSFLRASCSAKLVRLDPDLLIKARAYWIADDKTRIGDDT